MDMISMPPTGTSLEASLDEVRVLYETRFPARESGFFSEADWNRCRAAMPHVRGPAVLEVGIGAGQIFNVLSRQPHIDELLGVDIRWNKKLIPPERGELQLMDILRLDIGDDAYDTVLCMEVLEHIETIEFPKALHEVRRVCRGTLIVTVPFEEPHPLWHHDVPGGHRQSFSAEKIDRFFPLAKRELVARGRNKCPWIMLVEDMTGGYRD